MQLNSDLLDDYHFHHSPETNILKPKRVNGDPTGTWRIFPQKSQDLNLSLWWTFLFALGYVLLCFKFYL